MSTMSVCLVCSQTRLRSPAIRFHPIPLDSDWVPIIRNTRPFDRCRQYGAAVFNQPDCCITWSLSSRSPTSATVKHYIKISAASPAPSFSTAATFFAHLAALTCRFLGGLHVISYPRNVAVVQLENTLFSTLGGTIDVRRLPISRTSAKGFRLT